jgi:hypothetical protein
MANEPQTVAWVADDYEILVVAWYQDRVGDTAAAGTEPMADTAVGPTGEMAHG